MTATINGVIVQGRPEEIAILIRLMDANSGKVVAPITTDSPHPTAQPPNGERYLWQSF